MNNFTEAYEFLLSVVGNVPYGVIAVDMDGKITMINDKAMEHLDLEGAANRLLETEILTHVHGIENLEKVFLKCLEEGRQPFEIREVFYHNKYLNFFGNIIMNGMLISINDVTETKIAQYEATQSLLKGQEMERRRLAKEIHDGIGPLMSTIRLNLDAVKSQLSQAPPKTLQQVETMDELIQSVATDIRSISHDLMPSALVDFGLIQGLKNLCDKVNNSGKLEVELFESGMKNRLKEDVELNLFRITQELLNNALKYSKANNIQIQLVKRKNKAVLTVEDDGIGFDSSQINHLLQNGIGLKNISTRVESLMGNLTIETQIGKGVQTIVEIPLS